MQAECNLGVTPHAAGTAKHDSIAEHWSGGCSVWYTRGATDRASGRRAPHRQEEICEYKLEPQRLCLPADCGGGGGPLLQCLQAGQLAAGFDAQVRQAFANLRTALHAAGAAPRDVARLTVLVVDHSPERLGTLGTALRDCWAGAPLPACTLIPVPRLALDGMLFEVDATAVLPPA